MTNGQEEQEKQTQAESPSNQQHIEVDKAETPKQFRFFRSWGMLILILFLAISLFIFTALVVILSLTDSNVLVSVPKVEHSYLVDVYNTAKRKGLKVELELKNVPELTKGYILEQDPQPGVLVKPGNKLTLTVARGTQFFEAPDLKGLPLKSVDGVLQSIKVQDKSANLELGELTYIATKEKQADVVLDQIPKPGERIRVGTKIHLLISKGKKQSGFRMADYTGQDIDLLYRIFEMRDIAVNYKVRYVRDKSKYGRVLSQRPRKGERIKEGDNVILTVGIFREELYHRVGYEVVRYRVPGQYGGKMVEVYIKDGQGKRRRYRKKVRAGERIVAVVRREGDATITVEQGEQILKKIQITENEQR